jgi:hypothetical protein
MLYSSSCLGIWRSPAGCADRRSRPWAARRQGLPSGRREGEQRFQRIIVRSLERIDIFAPWRARIDEIDEAQSARLFLEMRDQQVRSRAREPPVTVWEGVDLR